MLSIATWNVGHSLTPSKQQSLSLLLCTNDVVMLQETSFLSVALRDSIKQQGFDIVESPAMHAGTCVLISRKLHCPLYLLYRP